MGLLQSTSLIPPPGRPKGFIPILAQAVEWADHSSYSNFLLQLPVNELASRSFTRHLRHHSLQPRTNIRLVIPHRFFLRRKHLRRTPLLWLTPALDVIPDVDYGDVAIPRWIGANPSLHSDTSRQALQCVWPPGLAAAVVSRS